MRCYNGCPDSALQAVLDNRSRLSKLLAQHGARVVEFPANQYPYQVWGDGRALSGEHWTFEGAAEEVLRELATHLLL